MKCVFTSFDFDNDEELRDALIGQIIITDSPFEIAGYLVNKPLDVDWKEKVRKRICMVNLGIVICGENPDKVDNISTELAITYEESKLYFLLWGRPDKNCKKPTITLKIYKIYEWVGDNLKRLIEEVR